jgi:hypothetical protein
MANQAIPVLIRNPGSLFSIALCTVYAKKLFRRQTLTPVVTRAIDDLKLISNLVRRNDRAASIIVKKPVSESSYLAMWRTIFFRVGPYSYITVPVSEDERRAFHSGRDLLTDHLFATCHDFEEADRYFIMMD